MWTWPQYAMVFWWMAAIILPILARAANVTVAGKPQKPFIDWLGWYCSRLISVGVLAFVLFSGGFFG